MAGANKDNLILELTKEFSLLVIKYVEALEDGRRYVIANQLLRSATSIGANVWEAQNSESKADFVHKFKIAAKEAAETEYWLILCTEAENYPDPEGLIEKLKTIDRILGKIISSTKRSIAENKK